MSLQVFPTSEKLAAVEAVLRTYRDAPRGSPERQQYDILKAVASDLRGRLEQAPSVSLVQIERSVVALQRARSPGAPYPLGPFVRVGEELIARWPTVKQALERFGAEVEREEVS